MDGISSAFAVVSLAIQLGGTVNQIRKYLRSVKNAPVELTRLVSLLDHLYIVLDQARCLVDQQTSVLGDLGSVISVANAVQNCNEMIKPLEILMQELQRSASQRKPLQRVLSAMKVVRKKEDITQLENHLRDAITTLQTATIINSSQIQIHHFRLTATNIQRLPAAVELGSALASEEKAIESRETEYLSLKSPVPRQASQVTTKEKSFSWYSGVFGNVDVRTRTISAIGSPEARGSRERVIVQENTSRIKPSFVRYAIEVKFSDSYWRVPTALRVYAVSHWGAPVFELCKNGDLEGLQVMFSSGSVSPFVIDEDGTSLLHYAAHWLQADVFRFLLRLGLDADLTTFYGGNSLDSLSTSKEAADYQDNTVVNQTVIDRTTNTLRAVIEAQDEVSAEDMTWFFADYHGAPEGVQFMLSQESCEIYDLNDDPSLFPVLATALRGYAVHSHWDPVIRKLIRRGDDLHAQFRKHTCLCPSISQCLNCFCGSRRCVTPLDRMLGKIADPFEAKDVGNAWLNILPSEGCDVRVYLEKEETLHTAQSQMISSGNDYHLKQLVIELGANPSVSWRWWYDPSCSAYLVHEEFANWNIHHEDQSPWFRSEWTETWPFEYSESADPFDRHKGYIPHKGDEMYDEWKKLHDLAQSRAENRLKKRAAKLGLLGGQENSSMPGGWPNER